MTTTWKPLTGERAPDKYSGAEWLRQNLAAGKKPRELSPFGERVADLLGQLYEGIYHVDAGALLKAQWDHQDMISIVLRTSGRFATFDHGAMTTLVVLAHDAAIRVEIDAAAFRHLRFTFTKRGRGGDYYHRHPTIGEAIAGIRRRFVSEEVSVASDPA